MCFSAGASFAASGGLAVAGVASLRIADRRQKMLAAMPLLFAAQQAFEGYQWLAIGTSGVCYSAAYSFLFFALLVWPIYVPVMIYVLDSKRRKLLRGFIGFGIALALYYFTLLLSEPLAVTVFNRSIFYQLDIPIGILSALLYFIATCGPMFVSSIKQIRWFGLAIFSSAIITEIFFFTAFISVWCFFAAILSCLIYFYLWNTKRS